MPDEPTTQPLLYHFLPLSAIGLLRRIFVPARPFSVAVNAPTFHE